MVGNIYFTKIPYSDFSQLKGRPILLFKELENDFLFLPLTSNLKRDGILLNINDLKSGSLKKESVVIVPKISAIDKKIILKSRLLATINNSKFTHITLRICKSLECK
jgi:mRNA-degrading endonuclease toxin of MazEF toxin-antitoxin module